MRIAASPNRWLFISSSSSSSSSEEDKHHHLKKLLNLDPTQPQKEKDPQKRQREFEQTEKSPKRLHAEEKSKDTSKDDTSTTEQGTPLPSQGSLSGRSPQISESPASQEVAQDQPQGDDIAGWAPEFGPNLNRVLTDQLQCLHDIYVASGKEWNAMAIKKAISSLRQCPFQIKSGHQAQALPNIGQSVSKKIDEILTNGRLQVLDDEQGAAFQLFLGIWGDDFWFFPLCG